MFFSAGCVPASFGDTKLFNKVAGIWEDVMGNRVVGALRVAILSACLSVPTICAAKAAEKVPEVTAPPMRVLVLPVDFDVLEMSAGGMIEPVPVATTEAEEALSVAAIKVLKNTKKFQIIDLPAMSEAEAAILKEHVALYKLTAINASQMIRMGGPAWKAKQKNFDYSIGDGLKFLVERSGADAAVVVAGAQVNSSGGRIAMMILLAAAGVAIPLGGAQGTAGIIDLNTGDIKWLEERMGTKGNIREKAGAEQTMMALVGTYPASTLLGNKAKKKKK
jgi:hypothetical protein